MKKTITRVLSLALVIITLFSALVIPTSAVEQLEIEAPENEIMPCYVSINSTSRSITISGLTATVSASVTAQYYTNLKIVIYLQKKESTGYQTVKSWEKTGTGYALSLEGERLINAFCDYRAYIFFTADQETYSYYAYP